MGVRCRVLGHVYDSTELEERREERPNGTVLICREYQVCRRCGNRDELYRNEQLLAKPETDTEEPEADQSEATPDSDADADTPDIDSETDGDTDTPEVETETGGDVEADTPATDIDTTEVDESVDETDSEEETGTERADTEAETNIETGGEILDGGDDDGDTTEPDGVREVPESDDTDDETTYDDGVILSESTSEVASLQNGLKSSIGEEPRTASASDSSPSGVDSSAPHVEAESAKAADGGQDTGGAIDTSSESWAVEITTADDEEIVCMACGQQWDRDSTSLRDGDLCPSCRRGYVESL